MTRVSRLKSPQVEEWLSHRDTYTLHKPVRHKFVRRRIVVGGLDHQFQADLIDVRKLKKSQRRFCCFVDMHLRFEQVCLGRPTQGQDGSITGGSL